MYRLKLNQTRWWHRSENYFPFWMVLRLFLLLILFLSNYYLISDYNVKKHKHSYQPFQMLKTTLTSAVNVLFVNS